MELICKIQTYAWGKIGSDSLVARLHANVNKNFKIDPKETYAELWMGTHVNAPSVLKETGETLSSVIEKNLEHLGQDVIDKFGKELPYLFKVLSVNKALSIQAHPSKKHAEELHAERPDIYKDPNHKPELAISLTPFEALCGFRPIEQIKHFIKELPELRNAIGSKILQEYENSSDEVAFLKNAFKGVLTCEKEKAAKELQNLLARTAQISSSERNKYYIDLIAKLNSEFPGDAGCFMVYFLNYLKLNSGEAIYLGANEPHAYLSGDCVECMACSDNVVRAGLTPKFIDVPTLCSMLIYKGENPESKLFQPLKDDDHTVVFKPPVPDFAVAQIKLPTSKESYKLVPRKTASILIVISGRGVSGPTELYSGVTLFIPAHYSKEISNIKEDLIMYQAFANV